VNIQRALIPVFGTSLPTLRWSISAVPQHRLRQMSLPGPGKGAH
jgi:hypothetical protein